MSIWQRRARPVAYGLLGLKPWEFARYTVREFEEAVVGAQIRHVHAFDLVMRHALATGQWSTRVTFRDLTGRDAPLPLDPRAEAAEADEGTTEDWMRAMETQIRLSGRVRVEDGPAAGGDA